MIFCIPVLVLIFYYIKILIPWRKKNQQVFEELNSCDLVHEISIKTKIYRKIQRRNFSVYFFQGYMVLTQATSGSLFSFHQKYGKTVLLYSKNYSPGKDCDNYRLCGEIAKLTSGDDSITFSTKIVDNENSIIKSKMVVDCQFTFYSSLNILRDYGPE